MTTAIDMGASPTGQAATKAMAQSAAGETKARRKGRRGMFRYGRAREAKPASHPAAVSS